MPVARTEVAIVGAGPAGLLLGRLLGNAGIETVVLELRDRDHVEHRQRAGILEQATMDVLEAAGVGARMVRERLLHDGVELRFGGAGHRVDLHGLTGRRVAIYAQTEVVKDLVAARLEAGVPLDFEVSDVAVSGLDTDAPTVTYTHDGERVELRCEVVAGCDGFHGACRQAIPEAAMTVVERDYPFAWLGILAQVAPSSPELIYANHEDGFALASMRSPEISRLYVQCDAADELEAWSEDRIWAALHTRLATDDGWTLREGPVLDSSITPMRSHVASPLRHGRLFLAGDAGHIVPPTGAKGLNLAVADVTVLAAALIDHLHHGDDAGIDAYSDRALDRVWRCEHFSWWMTAMLHRFPGADGFDRALQRSQLDYLAASEAARTSLAENYVGLPL